MGKHEEYKHVRCPHKADIYYLYVRGDTIFEECFWCWIKVKYKIKPKQNRRTRNQVVLDKRKKSVGDQQGEAVKNLKEEVKKNALCTKQENRRKVRRSGTYRRKSRGPSNKNHRKN